MTTAVFGTIAVWLLQKNYVRADTLHLFCAAIPPPTTKKEPHLVCAVLNVCKIEYSTTNLPLRVAHMAGEVNDLRLRRHAFEQLDCARVVAVVEVYKRVVQNEQRNFAAVEHL